MQYRFEKNEPIKFEGKYLDESQYINKKISKIDDELAVNIKRRIQLQKKMYKDRQ